MVLMQSYGKYDKKMLDTKNILSVSVFWGSEA